MVLLGLGSNRGDSTQTMVAAIEALDRFAQPGSLRSSRLWRTTPVDCPPDSGDFVNSAAVFDPILAELKQLERQFGRGEKHVRNAPRELELDLLLFDDELRDSENFVLPHPRAKNRLFVLQPAVELVPDVMWPNTGKTLQQLLDELETDERVMPLPTQPPFYVA